MGHFLFMRKLILLLILSALITETAHAGTISHTPHETPSHAYYASLPAGYRLTHREKLEVLTIAGWPVELHDEAVQVINCESWYGIVDTVGDGGLAHGLFQIHWHGWTSGYPEAFTDFKGDPFNPVDNARLALMIYQRDVVLYRGDGWRQWSCKPLPIPAN